MKYFILLGLLAAGCVAKTPPTETIRATGRLITDQGDGDITFIFTPPDKFRIIGNHFIAGRYLDFGSDGKTIWYVTREQYDIIKGKIVIDDADHWQPNTKTFIQPKGKLQ